MNKLNENFKPVYESKSFYTIGEDITWESLEYLAKELKEGWIVLWQYHTVTLGKIKADKVDWLAEAPAEPVDKHLVRLRAFNEKEEFHFWKQNQRVVGRHRIDSDGAPMNCVDTKMLLRGGVAKLIYSGKRDKENSEELFVAHTRNYIDFHSKTGQAGYVDCRFLDLEKIKENINGK